MLGVDTWVLIDKTHKHPNHSHEFEIGPMNPVILKI